MAAGNKKIGRASKNRIGAYYVLTTSIKHFAILPSHKKNLILKVLLILISDVYCQSLST